MYHPDAQLCRVICVLKNASPMNQLSEARLAALGRGHTAASVKWIGARDSEQRSSWRSALGRRRVRGLWSRAARFHTRHPAKHLTSSSASPH